MEATSDGFLLSFTRPIDKKIAGDVRSYRMISYTYPYSSAYGGDEINTNSLTIQRAEIAADGRSVTLRVSPLRAMYVHELHADGVRSADGNKLLHADAYYTLNRIPKQ